MLRIAKSLPQRLTSRPYSSTFIDYGKANLVTSNDHGVHGNMKSTGSWRNKPLFRREGDARFKTGQEAGLMLLGEAERRDAHETEFISTVSSTMTHLSTVFDRSPRYAWIAKQLLEPERILHFRVAWIDDVGVQRTNRGYRIQYNSALGGYEGSLHFGHHVNSSVLKSIGFDTVFSNALTGYNQGAAVGGADFNPLTKSEAEIQRFCQSYMTELSKYIGPDHDVPNMGMGCGVAEIGYLFGQYKRINSRTSSNGKSFLWGGTPSFPEATGYGIAHYAEALLNDKNESLEGKRCLIYGSGKVAQTVAEKLIEYGAVPIAFSDTSGHIYEPEGFDRGKLRTVVKVKKDRGAKVGRYIIASTTCQYNDPANFWDIPCDLVFPCGPMGSIDKEQIQMLSEAGCEGVIEGGYSSVTPEARIEIKKQGMHYLPSSVSLTGPTLVSGMERELRGKTVTDEDLKNDVIRVFKEVKSTAQEFNTRGDLHAGSAIMGFLRVANVMAAQGAV
ncbi:hypothetical protein TrVE_jg2170 [Triparma verrucosa]|uniref:glutamate dehydrogenase (NADP(+)) n=1 Tax=Triparma verrucosa TaxID=1606542 RepID=A0A9W7FLM4_9STRA|nr:hypothetical protein TrVE_jg2170 [Triparma verrucosa]